LNSTIAFMSLSPFQAQLLAAFLLFATAFALSAVLSVLVRRLAPRVGLVDKPGGRKAHKAPTPLGGGVAIWLAVLLVVGGGAVVLALGVPLPEGLAEHRPGLWSKGGHLLLILGLATAVMLMGLADDRIGLGWKPRLAVQVGLAGLLVLTGARITLFGPLSHPLPSSLITILWVVGLTNSFNFLDNMDGLAGGVGLIAALLFAGAQAAVGSLFVPALLVALAGALGGFLVHNLPPARLFMGDAGSNFLGFLLGALTVVGTFTDTGAGDSPYGVLTPLLVMAVPLYDTVSVIAIRLREGRSPFQPDRCHFSHRLVDRGLSGPWAVRAIYLVTLVGGLGALLLHRLDAGGAAVVLGQTLCLIGLVAILELGTRKTEPRHGATRPGPATSHPTDAGKTG
jgi:UDP-GlcNAc:undecaprenyl-phosphate GlcNAc-1-phosphate transferase